jgi:hypothetical protein
MAFVVYLLTRACGWLLRLDRSDHASELEILVLRHQLKVLRRTKPRPQLSGIDRALLAAFSRMLPRERWASFLVSPRTLLRWHRELVRRKWTYGRRGRPGRPPIGEDVVGDPAHGPGEPPVGGAFGSPASSPSWASGSAPRRSARSFADTGSAPLRGGTDRRGPSSCGHKRTASSPRTSSLWRRSA